MGMEKADGGGSGGGPGHGAGSGGGGSTKFCGGAPRHLQSQKHGGPIGHSGCFSAHNESSLLGKSFQWSSTTGGSVVVVVATVVVVVVGGRGSPTPVPPSSMAMVSASICFSASSTEAWRSSRTTLASAIALV